MTSRHADRTPDLTKSETHISGLNFRLEVQLERFVTLWSELFSVIPPVKNVPTVTVRLAQQPGDSAPSSEAILLTKKPGVSVHRAKNAFWFAMRGMSCAVRPDRLYVSLDEGFWSNTLFEQRNFLLVTMVALLRLNGIYAFHGNGLVHNGKGIVISGSSGAGKTTLTHSLISSGWNYLADDAIAFRSSDRKVEAYALRRGFSLKPDARERTSPPALWNDGSLQDLGNGKFMAAPTDLVEKQFASKCTPSALFFCEVGHRDETVITQISETTALVLSLEQAAGLLADHESSIVHLNILRDLVDQCACYKIISGRDVIESAESARRVSELILGKVRAVA